MNIIDCALMNIIDCALLLDSKWFLPFLNSGSVLRDQLPLVVVYHATNYLYKTSAFLHFCIGNVSVILISNSSEFDGIKNHFRDATKKVGGGSGRYKYLDRSTWLTPPNLPLIASPD
jgi:hypothetical protein